MCDCVSVRQRFSFQDRLRRFRAPGNLPKRPYHQLTSGSTLQQEQSSRSPEASQITGAAVCCCYRTRPWTDPVGDLGPENLHLPPPSSSNEQPALQQLRASHRSQRRKTEAASGGDRWRRSKSDARSFKESKRARKSEALFRHGGHAAAAGFIRVLQ